MKETSILFSRPMVRAILAGSKTETRRVITPQPEPFPAFPLPLDAFAEACESATTRGLAFADATAQAFVPRCPYGRAGDRLYVKETFFAFGYWETRFDEKKGRDAWHFRDLTLETGRAYVFDEPADYARTQRLAGITPTLHRRPAIFMPRAAARIWLDVTAVRAERLQAITPAGVYAEGVGAFVVSSPDVASEMFAALWNGINAGRGFGWGTDPFVWVVQFRRTDRPAP